MRYFLSIGYDGSRYHGWQIQHDAISVQQTIDDHLSVFLREEIKVVGCGRTDAGVHASYYVLHFDCKNEVDRSHFIYRFNRYLPEDIVCYSLVKVRDDAHARYDATLRSYRYAISLRKPLFDRSHLAYIPVNWSASSLELLNSLSTQIGARDDFRSFCKAHSGVSSFLCHIDSMYWVYDKDTKTLYYHVCSNRFLRGMIRLLVGSHLRLLNGKATMEEILSALDRGAEQPNAWSAPAQGLYLTDVRYKPACFLDLEDRTILRHQV